MEQVSGSKIPNQNWNLKSLKSYLQGINNQLLDPLNRTTATVEVIENVHRQMKYLAENNFGADDHLEYLFRLFEFQRNLCAERRETQEMMARYGLLTTAHLLLQRLVLLPQTNVTLNVIRMGCQMLSNVMTGNEAVQNSMLPQFFESDLLEFGIKSSDSKLRKSTLIWLYNCTHFNSAPLVIKTLRGIDLLVQMLSLIDEFAENIEGIEFELCVGIFTSALENDGFPLIWDRIGSENLKISFLKLLDGVVNANDNTSIMEHSIDNTMYKMGLIFNESVNLLLYGKPNLDIIRYSLEFWKPITESCPKNIQVLIESQLHSSLASIFVSNSRFS
jgi:hypothetical protein